MKKFTSFIYSFLFIYLATMLAGIDQYVATAISLAVAAGLRYIPIKIPKGAFASVVAGDFSCADLVTITGFADKLWADNATKGDYMPKSEAAQVILKEQTAVFVNGNQLAGAKDNVIRLEWVNACITAEERENKCLIGGDQLSAGCQEYQPTLDTTASFTVSEETMRTTSFDREMVVAKGQLSAVKALDEYFAQQAVAYMITNAGVNQYTGGQGTVVNDVTNIAPALWTSNLFGYFGLVSVKNRFGNPYLLSGENLYQAAWAADMNSGNGEGKGTASMFGSLRKYFDLFNVDAVADPDKLSFLIDKSALALGGKNYYTAIPVEYKQETRYAVPSLTLPGIMYDVAYTNVCEGNFIHHKWTFYLRGGIYLNPTGCNANVTGILKFACGS